MNLICAPCCCRGFRRNAPLNSFHLVAVEAAPKASLNSLFIKYKTETRNHFYRNLTAVEVVLSFIKFIA